jgi:aspartate/methionine/tyrosine aminotransferase
MQRCERMEQVQRPIIPIVGQWIREHPGTISLGQGVAPYGPPKKAIDQIQHFLANPEHHKYQAVEGITPLREKLQEKLQAENGIILDSRGGSGDSKIFVTAGGNMAFVNAVLALTDPGDEIILLRPYYFNHEMAVRITDCRPEFVDTNEQYQPVPNAIQDALTSKTRAVVTISPNNPTGAVYSEDILRQINEICRQHKIYHIHDEAYEYFTYNEAQHFSPGSIAGSNDHTISLFSFSKAYGFASWRIGYMVYPAALEVSIKKIQDTILICPPVISQYAALGALAAGPGYCQQKQKSIREAREVVINALGHLDSFCTVPVTDGAFYFLLKIDTPLRGMELAERLVRDFGVAVIPGETFGLENQCYLRLSYGPLQKETAQEGIERLVTGLQTIVRT